MVLSMERWQDKVAIVTGTSAGNGAAIAQILVEAGLKVVGIARRVERVEALSKQLMNKKGKLYPYKADMMKEEEILKAFNWVKKNLGPVHILINNAGVAQQTNLIDGDTEKWKKILATNVLALCIATREAVKIMTTNSIDGHIVHINSVAGHGAVNFPYAGVYAASKAAVTALTETLRQELNRLDSKIKISSVSPGACATEILQTNNFVVDSSMIECKKPKYMPFLKPEDVADAVLYVLSTPPQVQVHELIIKPVGEYI